jgi:hypothetical protein
MGGDDKMAERNVETVQPLLRGNGTEQRFALLMLWFAAQHVVSDSLASTNEMREIGKGRVCKEAECRDLSPPWFTGRWRDWHRGHGCGKDDGRQRTPEGQAEIDRRHSEAAEV